jgi:hypothetical protein
VAIGALPRDLCARPCTTILAIPALIKIVMRDVPSQETAMTTTGFASAAGHLQSLGMLRVSRTGRVGLVSNDLGKVPPHKVNALGATPESTC